MHELTAFDEVRKGPKLTQAQKDKLIADACAEWYAWTEETRVLRDESLEAWQLYNENKPDSLKYDSPDDAMDSSSSVRRPVIPQAVDSIHAQQHLGKFPSDERFFRGKPLNEVAKGNQDLYESHCENRFSEDDFLLNAEMDLKNLILDGTSVVVAHFERKVNPRKAVYEFKKFLGLIPMTWAGPVKKYRDFVEYEGTPFIPIQFEDWRVNPKIADYTKSPFLFTRWEEPEVIRNTKGFENTDEVEAYSSFRERERDDKRLKFEYQGITYAWSHGDTPGCGGMAMLIEKWGNFWIEDKFYENHVLVFSNDSTFHYFGPNPYDHGRIPFILSSYIPVPGSPYGKSGVKDVIPLAHAEDTTLNQVIDIMSRCANPGFTYMVEDAAILEFFGGGKVSIGPGDGIPVQSHDSIRPFELPKVDFAPIVQLMQSLKEEIRESTGGVPYATGGTAAADNDRTLGEVQILASGTSTRFQFINQRYEKTKLRPYLHLVFENDRQFMSEPVMVPRFAQPLTPAIVKMMDMKFDVTGSKAILDRGQELNDLRSFVTELLPPMLKSGMAVPKKEILEVDMAGMIKKLAQLARVRDEDDLLKIVASPDQITEEASSPEDVMSVLAGGGPEQNGFNPVPQPGPGQAPRDLAAA